MKKAVKKPTAPKSEEKEVGTGKAWILFAVFGLLILVVVGFYGYTQYAKEKERKANSYNGFDFAEASGGLWITRIEIGQQPYDVPFYYHPRDTESVVVGPNVTRPILRTPRVIYISLDPDAGSQPVIAAVELSRLTGSKYNFFNIETHGALSRPPPEKVDLPVYSCANATPDLVVLQFIQGETNAIVVSRDNPNCVLFSYINASESIRVADRYAYMLLKIM
jgi:hypothetical protein